MRPYQPPPPDWLYAVFGIELPHLLAGLFGGTVRGLVSKGFTWPQCISSAVAGALTAGCTTPAAVPVLQR